MSDAPKQSLAPRSEETITLRPETDIISPSTAAPTRRYYTRCLELAWGDFRAKLRQEATVGGITGIGVILVTVVLFLANVVPWVSLLPVGVFASVLLLYFVFVLLRAPVKLEQGKQSEIDGLNATVKELHASIFALEGELDTEVNNHAKDIQNLNKKNENMWNMVCNIGAEKQTIEEERDSLKSQIEELTIYSLFLVVDTNLHFGDIHDLGDTFQSNAGHFIEEAFDPFDPSAENRMGLFSADLRIFFENRGADKVVIRTVRASLLRKTNKGREKRIRTGSASPIEIRPITSSPLTLDGWSVEGLTMIEPMYFRWRCELPIRIGRRLDRNCFLRISMDVMNQPLLNVDLDVDWETSRAENSTVPVSLRS